MNCRWVSKKSISNSGIKWVLLSTILEWCDFGEKIVSSYLFNNLKYLNKNVCPISAFEFPLYTDMNWITGEFYHTNDIPFSLLNANISQRDTYILLPRIVLRYFNYIDTQEYINQLANKSTALLKQKSKQKSSSSLSTYIPYAPEEEIAAILSLSLGIRIKAGNKNREFSINLNNGTNYFGSVLNIQAHLNPSPINLFNNYPIVPNAVRFQAKKCSVCLNDSKACFEHIFKIKDLKKYSSVIRAAKLYSDALWLSEKEPQLSWILLVSAIETAADASGNSQKNSNDLLQKFYPDLAEVIDKCGNHNAKIKAKVSEILYLPATKKFVEFITEHYPKPKINDDVPEIYRVNWEEFEIILKKIYELRSKALHSGQPFPDPMCEQPFKSINNNIIMAEKPLIGPEFLGESILDTENKPLLLWKFEDIVRNSLLNWINTF